MITKSCTKNPVRVYEPLFVKFNPDSLEFWIILSSIGYSTWTTRGSSFGASTNIRTLVGMPKRNYRRVTYKRYINSVSYCLLIIYYTIFICGFVYTVVTNPALNWDMIGYVAAAKHVELVDPIELHTYVFNNLKNFVSQEVYDSLTDNAEQYRIDIAAKPALFMQQLPFYEIRPIYTFSILLLSKLGINIFSATYAVPIVTTVLGILITLSAIRKRISVGLLYILPFFLLSFGILHIASLSTPDALVFLSVSIFIYLFGKEKFSALILLTPIVVLIRTDMIIFCFLALGAIFLSYQQYRLLATVSFVVTLILYLSVNQLFHSYGWSTTFAFTFIERVSNPANVRLNVSFADYIRVLKVGINKSLLDYAFFAFASMASVNIFLVKILKISFSHNIEIWLYFIIPISYVCIHFLLFPVTSNRFFTGVYLMNTIAFFLLLTKLINERNYSATNSAPGI